VRLTNKTRDEIIEKVLEDKIKPQRVKLEANLRDLAQHAVELFKEQEYLPEVHRWIDSAPTGGLPLISRVRLIVVNTENKKVSDVYHSRLDIRDRWKNFDTYSLSKPVKVLSQDKHQSEFRLDENSLLGKEILAEMQKVNDLNAHEIQLEKTIMSALKACTTHKQIAEHYEDLVQFIPKPEVVAKLPALTNDDISKCLKGVC
jgi:hypothetical protein